jgi:hypothetical protein
MSVPTADDAPKSVFTSSDRIAVPDVAIELLRRCIKGGVDGEDSTERIRAAITPICAEAKRTQAMPEQLIVSLKELCRSLPEFDGIRGPQERALSLDTVVKVAIEEYYRA